MGLISCSETSVGIYRSTMRKIPKERRYQANTSSVRKFPAFYGTQNLLRCSEEVASYPCPEPYQTNPLPPPSPILPLEHPV